MMHGLIGLKSTALTAAVALSRSGSWNFPQEVKEVLKKKTSTTKLQRAIACMLARIV